ncbi:hypothetical protein B566_EDAN016775 [Ephemera danica]|nr:hypothetical protein B566_EDAN016775 [Ephemera danica]
MCDVCTKFELLVKASSATEDDITGNNSHREEVKACRDEKNRDKKLDPKTNSVFVVDVEKVLPIPKLNNSIPYYLQKIQLKNYSSFDLLNKDVLCYLIQEIEGGSDASVYATLFMDLIEQKKSRTPTIRDFSIWSDTYDYADAIRQARLDEAHGGKPGSKAYEVQIVSHTKFMNFEKCQYYSAIRPGQRAGDPTVNKLRVLKYTPDGMISYKLSFLEDEWQQMGHRLASPYVEITPKYQEKLPLSSSKYRDMIKMKAFVPTSYHTLYEQLPHT